MTIRSETLAGAVWVSALTAFLLLTPGAPTSGVTGPLDKAAPQPDAVTAASGPAGCEQGSTPSVITMFEGPGAAMSSVDGVDRGGRTCRCSCGYPCKTDADCGGGVGSCRGGISCC